MLLKEFNASSITSLTRDVKKEYYSKGAVVVKGLFNKYDLQPSLKFLYNAINLLENKTEAIDDTAMITTDEISKRLDKLISQNSEAQSILYDSISNSPDLHLMSSTPKILNIIKILFGENIMLNNRLIMLMSLPNETWHLARWHQDYFYNWGPKDSCTVYIPMQKTKKENGGLVLALGSHITGELPHCECSESDRSKWKSIPNDYIDNLENKVEIDLDLGDVLFFHSLLAHTPQVNTSTKTRFVMNFRYQNMRDKKFLEDGWRIGYNGMARNALARKIDETS